MCWCSVFVRRSRRNRILCVYVCLFVFAQTPREDLSSQTQQLRCPLQPVDKYYFPDGFTETATGGYKPIRRRGGVRIRGGTSMPGRGKNGRRHGDRWGCFTGIDKMMGRGKDTPGCIRIFPNLGVWAAKSDHWITATSLSLNIKMTKQRIHCNVITFMSKSYIVY